MDNGTNLGEVQERPEELGLQQRPRWPQVLSHHAVEPVVGPWLWGAEPQRPAAFNVVAKSHVPGSGLCVVSARC